MGLINSRLCRRCAADEETQAQFLCGCEVLTSLGHVYLDSFFLDPEDVKESKCDGGGGGCHLEL